MSKLDKEKVLADFTEAYQKAHGKQPDIESSNGWYSVDGGKNVRLAQLADDAKSLGTAKQSDTKKKPDAKKTESKKADTKKAAPKKAENKKSVAKKSSAKPSSSGGLTAKELWKQKLADKGSECRLPRGSA